MLCRTRVPNRSNLEKIAIDAKAEFLCTHALVVVKTIPFYIDRTSQIPIAGLSVRNFKGFSSLQEVECWGGHLDPEVKLLSLKMYTIPEQKVLAYLFLVSKECMTYSEYSSCFIDESDPRKSGLRVLVSDLAAGERRMYGCEADRVKYLERTKTTVWSILLERNSEYCVHLFFGLFVCVSLCPCLSLCSSDCLVCVRACVRACVRVCVCVCLCLCVCV